MSQLYSGFSISYSPISAGVIVFVVIILWKMEPTFKVFYFDDLKKCSIEAKSNDYSYEECLLWKIEEFTIELGLQFPAVARAGFKRELPGLKFGVSYGILVEVSGNNIRVSELNFGKSSALQPLTTVPPNEN